MDFRAETPILLKIYIVVGNARDTVSHSGEVVEFLLNFSDWTSCAGIVWILGDVTDAARWLGELLLPDEEPADRLGPPGTVSPLCTPISKLQPL